MALIAPKPDYIYHEYTKQAYKTKSPEKSMFEGPLPGEMGGGTPPDRASPAISELAKQMVPGGEEPVAVFPPFETPRTYPAVAVIFTDKPKPKPVKYYSNEYGVKPKYREKRALSFRHLHNFIQQRWHGRRPSKRRFWRKSDPPSPSSTFAEATDSSEASKPDPDLVEEAFEEFEKEETNFKPSYEVGGPILNEDFYGFSVMIRLVDEPCELGVTCDENGNKMGEDDTASLENIGANLINRIFLRRQTGEDFSSSGPPECRSVVNPNGCV